MSTWNDRFHENQRFHLDRMGRPLFLAAAIWDIRRAFPESPAAVPAFEIAYLHSGNLTLELEDGSQLNARGGDLYLLQPNTRHRCLHDVMMPCIYVILCVKPAPPFPCQPFVSREELTAVLRALRKAGNCVVRGCAELDTAFLALRKARMRPGSGEENGSPLHTLLSRGLLYNVFIHMLRSIATPGQTPHYAAISRARHFINQHLTDHFSMEQVAQAAGLSTVRMRDLFHAETGETPADYRLRLRLERARQRLRDPAASVTEIALELAFASSQHFAVSFRKHFGVSPSTYRRLSKK